MSGQHDLFLSAKPSPPVGIRRGWYRDHDSLMRILSADLEWEQHSMSAGGSRIPMPRLECFYGPEGGSYSYSGTTHPARPLDGAPGALRVVMCKVSDVVGTEFNAMFANLYRTGRDSIGWHSDDESVLGSPRRSVIASLSLGAVRRFSMREIADPTNVHRWDLGPGDLFVMRAGSQASWAHAANKTAKHVGPRIALTFRKLVMR